MKNLVITFTIVFSLFFSSVKSLFGQEYLWSNQTQSLNGYPITKVCSIDTSRFFAVGANGLLRKYYNGWEYIASPTRQYLWDVQFPSDQVGYAVGGNGTILKTVDGGNTWKAQRFTSNNFSCLHFLTTDIGFIASSNGFICKTTNGGNSWTVISGPSGAYYKAIQFFSETQGICLFVQNNVSILRKTIDGGITWSSFQIAINNCNDFCFPSPLNGWVVGNYGCIYRTTDGGQTWNLQITNTTQNLYGIDMKNDLRGMVVGANETILRLNNGGINWSLFSPGGVAKQLNSIAINKGSDRWLASGSVSYEGSLWDFGEKLEGNSEVFSSIHFANTFQGSATTLSGLIYSSTNGGVNWLQNVVPNTIEGLNDIHLNAPNKGWAVGSFGKILKRNNLQTWDFGFDGLGKNFHSVFFKDENFGWISGQSDSIIKTTNGGLNWNWVSTGFGKKTIKKLKFLSESVGFATLNDSVVIKSENGGQTWGVFASINSQKVSCFHFFSPNKGWIGTQSGNILYTTNGGQNWTVKLSNINSPFTQIAFFSEKRGMAIGQNGLVRITYDGGLNWNIPNLPIQQNFTRFCHLDSSEIWLAGPGGTIQKGDLNIDGSLVSGYGVIKGKVGYADYNCTLIPQSTWTTHPIVKALPGPFYALADFKGNYKLKIPLRSFFVKYRVNASIPLFNEQLFPVCPPPWEPSNFAYLGPSLDSVTGINFGLKKAYCHNLEVRMIPGLLRNCRTGRILIDFFNNGTIPAPDAYVLVEFPDGIIPISSSKPHQVISDNLWKINLGTVAAFETGRIIIKDSVKCGSAAGINLCYRVSVFPASNCPNYTNWDGSFLSLNTRCINNLVEFGVFNNSDFPMTDSVEYKVYLDSVVVKVGKIKLTAGDSLKMLVNPLGMAATLWVNQSANNPISPFTHLSNLNCQPNPGFVPRVSQMNFPTDPNPYSFTQCQSIVGSFDPNDKSVQPKGFTNLRFVPIGSRLDYLIRFQNVGNDTAFKVVIIDSLDKNLNPESFKMVMASHSYHLEMSTTPWKKTYLKWTFDNILLPDSIVNEPESHGFVRFSIAPNWPCVEWSNARNEAAIYFDFNEPVITNKTLTTFRDLVYTNFNLGSNVQIISEIKPLEVEKGILGAIYPNPVSNGILHVKFPHLGHFEIRDLAGRLIMTKESNGNDFELPMQLKPGVYFARFLTESANQTEKILVLE